MGKIAIFGSSCNPPHLEHLDVVRTLVESGQFDRIIVVPCGGRPKKPTVNDIDPLHRAAMTDLAFRGIPGVEVDLFDLEESQFHTAARLESRYRRTGHEVWHAVGSDLVVERPDGRGPEIREDWEDGKRIWDELNWVVMDRGGYDLQHVQLPPHCLKMSRAGKVLSGTDVRSSAFERAPLDGLVTPEVAAYIERHNLYRGAPSRNMARIRLAEVRPFVVADQYNERAVQIATRIPSEPLESANVIITLGGDGTMLRAVKDHWRRRIPFFGLNLGHAGYLMNTLSCVFEDHPYLLLEALAKDELICRHLPLLRARYRRPGEFADTECYAFNDVWLERREIRPIVMGVTIHSGGYNHVLDCAMGDGVLMATAAGSTAYAQSMGAVPLSVESQEWLMIGNNIGRPNSGIPQIPLGRDSMVVVKVDQGDWRPARLCADTDVVCEDVDRVAVNLSRAASAEIAFMPETDLTLKLMSRRFPGRSC